jgi:hypothetical protein
MIRPVSSGEESKDTAAQPSPPSASLPSAYPLFPSDPEELREELRVLRQRERDVMALLNCSSPQRILHDIRNLLNEVQLLRYLAEKND